jgi:hypothetical protein
LSSVRRARATSRSSFRWPTMLADNVECDEDVGDSGVGHCLGLPDLFVS